MWRARLQTRDEDLAVLILGMDGELYFETITIALHENSHYDRLANPNIVPNIFIFLLIYFSHGWDSSPRG